MSSTEYLGSTTLSRPVSLTREGSSLRLAFAFDRALVDRAKSLPHAAFDQETKTWTCQLSTQAVEQLRGWFLDGLTDVSIDALILPTEVVPTVAPATLRPGTLRRPYQVALALRDDRIYARLRAIPGATWVKETSTLSYGPQAAAALSELVERGVLDDPAKLLSATAVSISFDARTGKFLVRGDERAQKAFDAYFPSQDVLAKWQEKGIDAGFSDSFSEEVYRGELARASAAPQIEGLQATLWPYQAQSVAVALERTGFGVFHEMGLGKALHVDTPVLTPLGYKPIGALTPGECVIGSNGLPTEVLGVFFQGPRPLYDVTFSCGTTIKADESHLWTVYDAKEEKTVTRTTKELLDGGVEFYSWMTPHDRYVVPLVDPVAFAPRQDYESPATTDPELRRGCDRASVKDRVARLAELLISSRLRCLLNFAYDSPESNRHSDHAITAASKNASSVIDLLVDPADLNKTLDLIGGLGGVASRRYPQGNRVQIAFSLPVAIRDALGEYLMATHQPTDFLQHVNVNPRRTIKAITATDPDEAVCIKVAADDELFVIENYVLTHNTVVAIALGHELMFNRHEVPRTVVVVPGAVRTQWAQEIARFSRGDVVVIDGDQKSRNAGYEAAKNASWVIVHYDVLARDYAQLAPLVAGSLLVADEAHRLKSPTAKRTKTMRLFAGKAARRLALTGTPIQNDPGEWYSVLSGFVSPGCFGSPQDFLNRYAYPSRFGGFEGARNLGELRERSATYYIRNVKSEVATHLPPLRVQHRPLDVDPQYRAALQRAHREARDEIKREALARAERLGRTGHALDGQDVEEVTTGAEMTAVGMLRLLCSSPRIVETSDSAAATALIDAGLLPDADGPKLDALREMTTELQEEGHRVVVFTFSKRMANLIAERMQEDGVRHVLFTGDTSKAARDAAVAAFTAAPTEDNPGPTVFIATDAGGEGLNLGRHCSLLINMDIPWTPGVLAQRSARIHRIDGTHDKYLVINFTLKGTIEEGILRMIERKADLQDAIFGEGGGRSRTTGRSSRAFFEDAMREWEEANPADEKIKLPKAKKQSPEPSGTNPVVQAVVASRVETSSPTTVASTTELPAAPFGRSKKTRLAVQDTLGLGPAIETPTTSEAAEEILSPSSTSENDPTANSSNSSPAGHGTTDNDELERDASVIDAID